MEILTAAALGFFAGSGISAYITGSFLPGGIFLGILSLFSAFFWKKGKKRRTFSILLGGAAAGLLWFSLFDILYLQPVKQLDGRVRPAVITVAKPVKRGKYGFHTEGFLFSGGKPYRVRLHLDGPSCSPGDKIEGCFRFRDNLEKPGQGKYEQGEGLFLTASQEGEIQREHPQKMPLWTLPGRMAAYAESVIRKCFENPVGDFAAALLLGDRGRLDFQTNWNLEISGIRHLVAVSGLHVSVLFILLSFLTLNRRWLTALIGFPVLLFFGAMTGFSPSVVRASIMMGLLLLSRLFKRRYDPLTELSAAALTMMVLNPLTVTSVSFQLSCASVAGIFLFYRKIEIYFLKRFPVFKDRREKIIQWICGSLALSFSSLTFVTPLCILYFGSISLAAPLTNLLTVWLIPVLFWGLLLLITLSFFSMGAAGILAIPLNLGFRYVLGIASLIARIPLAAVFTQSVPILIWVMGVYFLGFYLLRKPVAEVIYFTRFTLLGLILAVGLSWVQPHLENIRITALDIGQGQCILLETRGKRFLVDCGGDRDEIAAEKAAKTLLSHGVSRLDGLILTHYDRDHVGGAPYLLELISADRIYLPEGPALPPDGRIQVVEDCTVLNIPQGEIRIYGSENRDNANEMGLCVLLDSPEYDILITGDRSRVGELELMEHYDLPRVDCLVAGHHGARDSTSRELLQKVRPETVLISAGKHNSYGHPAGETLLRLEEFGCRILRTDLLGTIIIRR